LRGVRKYPEDHTSASGVKKEQLKKEGVEEKIRGPPRGGGDSPPQVSQGRGIRGQRFDDHFKSD